MTQAKGGGKFDTPLGRKAELMGDLTPTYYRVPLPALDMELSAARVAEGPLYFPVATACTAIGVDVRTQRSRILRDFGDHVERMRLVTAGGSQEYLCIDHEAIGLWLATIQPYTRDGKTDQRKLERLRMFRRLVMQAASAILMGQIQPVKMLQSAQGLTDLRLAQLERAVFVGDPADDGAGRDVVEIICPHCAGPISVDVTTRVVVRGE